VERPEIETAAKVILAGIAIAALFLIIAEGDWSAGAGFAPSDRSNVAYDDFATDLFVNHGFELVVAALIIAAATLGGLQIAREEEYD